MCASVCSIQLAQPRLSLRESSGWGVHDCTPCTPRALSALMYAPLRTYSHGQPGGELEFKQSLQLSKLIRLCLNTTLKVCC
jgi:hypothetical protein